MYKTVHEKYIKRQIEIHVSDNANGTGFYTAEVCSRSPV
jgi:hypothetical protein